MSAHPRPVHRSTEGPSLLALLALTAASILSAAAPVRSVEVEPPDRSIRKLRLAIVDLEETFGPDYPDAGEYLRRLADVERRLSRTPGSAAARRELEELRSEALLANPLLEGAEILLVKRRWRRAADAGGRGTFRREAWMAMGLPSNHECNSSLPRTGWDNELAILSPARPDGRLRTLLRPDDGGYVGEVDLHWDGDRILFTRSGRAGWRVWETRLDGGPPRQVSRLPDDVDCFDACYLPDGGIVFGSTASFQSVPCWHGQRRVTNLYRMEADGSGARQLCHDQDHDLHPCVLPDGQVLFHRWDYTGINHIFLRQLMTMRPDGTNQRAVYGASSWYPNSLYFPRGIPGHPGRVVSILSGYHGAHRMGQLVIVDLRRGWYGQDGLVTRISGRGDPIRPIVRDQLVDEDWPKFLHPWPLSDRHFLVAGQESRNAEWTIYLADVFDNLVPVRAEPGHALLEPVLVRAAPRPPVLAEHVDPERDDAVVLVSDVHSGPGLEGVPRGTVKRLRVVAYDFGYPGLAGPDKIGYGGPWEAMRILGTVPVEADGSALFRVPASTPISLQALDARGRAVQLMRSWYTAMPGETVSCVGCHDGPAEMAPSRAAPRAVRREPSPIAPWRGPPRGFDFAREVQPVLDRHCVGCHDGREDAAPDLRREELVAGYRGRRLSDLGVNRLHPEMRRATGGVLRYTPSYEALLPYIRRVGIEDDVQRLVPGEYHVDTSELIQILEEGHHGVRLDDEAMDRLVTWIDLNAPCHGTWGDVFPIPGDVHERRMALRRLLGGPTGDPERVPELRVDLPSRSVDPARPSSAVTASVASPDPGAPERAAGGGGARRCRAAGEARPRQTVGGSRELWLDLGGGVRMRLVRVPAAGLPRGFWIGACEVTNEQLRRFDPSHDPRYYTRRHARADDRGLPLDGPRQPAVRVSWERAIEFCRWLSDLTGREVSLPSAEEWEHACRAGTDGPAPWSDAGDAGPDFSAWENLADRSFATGQQSGGRQVTGGVEHLVMEGAALSDTRFDDGAVVTADVGGYRPNRWGLHDMCGNAAEWTRSPDPSRPDRRIVCGGSFFDRPTRSHAGVRRSFPTWRRVVNVGFRVVCAATEGRVAALPEPDPR